MSRQDLARRVQGDRRQPAIKARIRRLQRQVRRRRMLEAGEARLGRDHQPDGIRRRSRISARHGRPGGAWPKGAICWPSRSSELARWHGIPLVENPPLAHALYRAVEVGQSIPPKLYAVVADILAAIYRAQQRARGQPAARPAERGRWRPDMARIRPRGQPKPLVEWIVPIAAVGLVFVMLVPLPSLLLDLLLATSITASVLVLLSAHPHSAAGAVLRLPQPAAAAHSVPAVAEPGLQPPHSAARQ